MSATVSTKWSRRSMSTTLVSSVEALRLGSRRQTQALRHLEPAAEVGQRTVAGPDLELAGLHHIRAVIEVEAEFAHGHPEGHHAGRARLQRDLFKPFQLPHRPAAARYKVAHVELRHLLTGPRAGVRHRDPDLDRPVRPHPRGRYDEILERKPRIAEAPAEREQRLQTFIEIIQGEALARLVRPAARQAVVIERKLAHRPRVAHRELAARVDVAEERLGDRGGPFRAGVPRHEDGRELVCDAGEFQRPPRDEDDDDGLACRRERFKERALPARPRDAGARGRLPRDGPRLAPYGG